MPQGCYGGFLLGEQQELRHVKQKCERKRLDSIRGMLQFKISIFRLQPLSREQQGNEGLLYKQQKREKGDFVLTVAPLSWLHA